jgi:glycosidase
MSPENPYTPEPYVKLTHPEWCKNSVIYQINIRQFTKEGTFPAAEKHLPRLKDLGVDILWIMPINKIGLKNRKGSLGSPYAVKDYYSINSEFGNMDDFKNLIKKIHNLNMHVILDWVPNHTAWDSTLVTEHPEWYARDWKGDFRPTPWWDWEDIIDLDYSNSALRKYMTEAMKFWVKETDIDGYRCDVAGFVPLDFWENTRKELNTIKPVFMLAEWESRDLHADSFDMTYAWSWYDAAHHVTSGTGNIQELFVYYSWNVSAFPEDSIRMTFLSNHDKNAWDGTQFEQFGQGLDAAIILSVLGEGMPLIYNGQEAGNTKRLKFFDKDEIVWTSHPVGDLYKKLITLKKGNSALWNGKWGARMINIPNSHPDKVFSFIRKNKEKKVFVILNFSNDSLEVKFKESLYHGNYINYMTDKELEANETLIIHIQPWSYIVLLE